jgi:hypothetical protein
VRPRKALTAPVKPFQRGYTRPTLHNPWQLPGTSVTAHPSSTETCGGSIFPGGPVGSIAVASMCTLTHPGLGDESDR